MEDVAALICLAGFPHLSVVSFTSIANATFLNKERLAAPILS